MSSGGASTPWEAAEGGASPGAPQVVVVRTGTANVASVVAALARAGASPRVSGDPGAVRDAPLCVLPGVGAFGAARRELDRQGLVEPLRERVQAGRPLLCICLGMQVLFEGSEESPGVPGLGVLRGVAERFPGTVRVPHLGWNRVESSASGGYVLSGHAFFANSFRVAHSPDVDAGGMGTSAGAWGASWCEHGGRFLAAAERGGVLACQFHPELSGRWGLELIRRWIDAAYPRAAEGASARTPSKQERTGC